MKNKTAMKCIEVLNSILYKPQQALEAKVSFIREHIEYEIVKNQKRGIMIKKSKELKGGIEK